MVGNSIGHYRVIEKLGAGGMGEVYRATDSRLGREVALKVLPEAFAADEQRMVRFEREAQLLAALNHPHIATIHGLEVAGGTRALVMELVEGPTLAGRIAQGPIPLEEALTIARQIAEAVEYAHERGIIHRDLKPANIKLTPDGKVKLLDFGLAKALEDSPAMQDISNSPTISAAATRAGIILGTAAYMAPEQAKGKPVDRRADIWAFGVVLYEMLSGKPLYSGETAPETLAHVITKDPTWSDLPASTPLRIRRLLERCLTKDPKRRLRDIGEARIAIEDYLANPAAEAASGAPSSVAAASGQPLLSRAIPWAGMAAFALAALFGFWRPWSRAAESRPAMPAHVIGELGVAASLFTEYGSAEVLSPDGTRIVFSATPPGGKLQLYIRGLDQLQASPLPGTEIARDPFFSPDGQWIAFFAGSKLKKISVQGGAAVTLCEVQSDRGGAWGEDGTIVFSERRGGLFKVSSAGGTPEPLTFLDEGAGDLTHRWPQTLPGGKAVLFTASRNVINFEDSDLVVQELTTKQKKIIYRGGFYGRYVRTGHVLFVHGGTLFAFPFDLKRMEAIGPGVPVLEQVVSSPGHAGAQFSISENGTLAYALGQRNAQNVSISWMTRDGKMQPLREAPGDYTNMSFSPDGKHLLLQVNDGPRADIWTYDWQRDTLTRLTFSGDSNSVPVWTPDGRRVTYSAVEKDGRFNLYWKRADGSGDAQRLSEENAVQYAGSWRPDGKVLAFFAQIPKSATGFDLYTLAVEGDEKTGWKPGESKILLSTPAVEMWPRFSPDGRWVAYESTESGSLEVYVRPFPGPGGKWQVSNGGGRDPVWSRSSKELFYAARENRIMVVSYSASGDSFQAGKPAVWSEKQLVTRASSNVFALHPDGKRVAVFSTPGGESQPQASRVTFVFNFFDELRRKLAAKQ